MTGEHVADFINAAIERIDGVPLPSTASVKTEAPPVVQDDPAEDEIIMQAMRTWTGKRRVRKDKWQGAPAWRPLQKATGVKFGINRRNALYLRVKEGQG